MKIISLDNFIEYKKGIYTLFIPKTKKELKESEEVVKEEEEIVEDIDPRFKVIGYYLNPLNCINKIIKIRSDKKYKGKESYEEISILIKQIKSLYLILHYSSTFKYSTRRILFDLIPTILNPLKITKNGLLLSKKAEKRLKKDLYIQSKIKDIYANFNKRIGLNN
jgi:hypothetical protein